MRDVLGLDQADDGRREVDGTRNSDALADVRGS
jgi:hypothetical protein